MELVTQRATNSTILVLILTSDGGLAVEILYMHPGLVETVVLSGYNLSFNSCK